MRLKGRLEINPLVVFQDQFLHFRINGGGSFTIEAEDQVLDLIGDHLVFP
jgi:hypothetical protein